MAIMDPRPAEQVAADPRPTDTLASRMAGGAFAVSAARKVIELLQTLVDTRDLPSDYDVTAVVSCNAAGGYQCFQINLPRTLSHVEVELSGVNTNSAAEGMVLFVGSVNSASAQAQISFPGVGSQADNAICASGGGKVTARCYLDGSAILTLCFVSVATPMIANVRVRSLDRPPDAGRYRS